MTARGPQLAAPAGGARSGGYVLPGRQTSGAGGAAAAAAGAPAGTRAIRINDLQDDEDGANAPNTSSQEDIDTAILRLQKHVTISGGATGGGGTGGTRSPAAASSAPGSMPSSQAGSQPSSLPGSQRDSGYNTPLGAMGQQSLSPPINSTPISASAGGSAAPTRPVSGGGSMDVSATASPTARESADRGTDRELHARVKLAAVQRARDVSHEGLKCYQQGQLAEAREHLVAAEAAFREVGETDAADEVARQRASIEAKLAKTARGNVAASTTAQHLLHSAQHTEPSSSSPATAAMTRTVASPQVAAPVCGVGMSFEKTAAGEHKITSFVAGSPAATCGQLQLGDVILKVNGTSVYGLSEAQIIQMVVGPPQTKVTITVQSQYGFPHVVTAPFQELPFDVRRDKKKKKNKSPSDQQDSFRAGHALYGGGTLPAGFEHLEVLRSTQPYTAPSLSVRSVEITRQIPTGNSTASSNSGYTTPVAPATPASSDVTPSP
eukprot:Tamp_11854.p1 GENE.Tamp_11854~~Tamp_11854.p1  ORF type:complete len:493 (+),score=69.36 Tamp_11854:84-1562(+)